MAITYNNLVKSIGYNQHSILKDIMDIHNEGKPFDAVHAIKVLKTIDTNTTNNYFNVEHVKKDTTTDALYNIYTYIYN